MTKTAKLSENEVFLLLKQKDENALSKFYDQYAPLIYGVILREVRNQELASKILQKTFTKIIDECNNMNCIYQSLFVWLLAITQKTASNDFKVSIDFKSLREYQKTSSGNSFQQGLKYQSESHSSLCSKA